MHSFEKDRYMRSGNKNETSDLIVITNLEVLGSGGCSR